MCPACIANITLMAVGATSGGGVVTAFVFRSFYRNNKRIKTVNNQNEKTSRKEKRPGETS
jgi:hypothetical protein